ncbi:MAG: hypothetical protein ACYDA6_09280 [Solirubrobacteraceae bacterium]
MNRSQPPPRRKRLARHAPVIASLAALAGAGAGCALALPTPAPVAAATAPAVAGATMEASFTPNRAGARTVLGYTLRFAGAGGALAPPVSKAAVLLPAGLTGTLQWPTTLGCSKAHLQSHGPRGCPARSQIGSGSAVLGWREGSRTVQENARIWIFVGPTDGAYQLEMLGEGLRPIRRRVVISEPLAALSGPYSADVEAIAPPIPTRSGLPDATLMQLSIRVGALRGPGMGIFVPRACAAGGFPWATELTYATGATETIHATTPCP